MSARRPRLLVVAGHDPSGAGIDADRAALEGLDLDVAAVVTARTDQDEHGVRSIGAREPATWLAEARAELARGVNGLKFGLLPGVEHVRSAVRLALELAERSPSAPVVVDPVLAASSGGRFLDADAVEAIRGELCGAGVVLTPNLAEAAEIARLSLARLVRSPAARGEAMCLLLGFGLRAVVLKGGHGSEDPVQDAWADQEGRSGTVEHSRVLGGSLRGSGCRFATRLAAELVLGKDLPGAVAAASSFVRSRIEAPK